MMINGEKLCEDAHQKAIKKRANRAPNKPAALGLGFAGGILDESYSDCVTRSTNWARVSLQETTAAALITMVFAKKDIATAGHCVVWPIAC
jgi:hypothetical protein